MGDSEASSGRGGSDPGTVIPKISVMSLGIDDTVMMGVNDARTAGDSRSAAGSSDVQYGAISVSSLSQQDASDSCSTRKRPSKPGISIIQMDADGAIGEEVKVAGKSPAAKENEENKQV